MSDKGLNGENEPGEKDDGDLEYEGNELVKIEKQSTPNHTMTI
jgi:hypothetical protein